MGEITFTGEAPYDLLLAQAAGAQAVGTNVVVTLTVNAQNKLQPPVPVRFELTVAIAQSLALQIAVSLRLLTEMPPVRTAMDRLAASRNKPPNQPPSPAPGQSGKP